MFEIIKRMKVRDERGFTLVELLIVIAIIAILAAIAIPQFAAYRSRALEASMVADAKNCATQAENWFSDNQTYVGFTGANAGYVCVLSPGNALNPAPAVTASTYTISVNNANARAGRTTHTLTNAGVTGWS
ncbi:MAG: prepilin-type N-terminal cleavage/methylation domain-containing protein [Nitrospirota bacterium]